MDIQSNSNSNYQITRLDDYDYNSEILITDEELDRELESVNEAYRVFEENEENENVLRNRHKNLKYTSKNEINTSNIIKIHKKTKTIYLTRFAFISLLLAVNMLLVLINI